MVIKPGSVHKSHDSLFAAFAAIRAKKQDRRWPDNAKVL